MIKEIELTELQQQIVTLLRECKGGYLALWHLEDLTGVSLSGCGVPMGDNAVEELVRLGIIRELPKLGCRFELVEIEQV